MGIEMAAEKAVVHAAAVGRVADERVGDAVHVAADLVHASRVGLHQDEGVAGRRVAGMHGDRQLRPGQGFKARGAGAQDVGAVTFRRAQGAVDDAAVGGPAPHDGQVLLRDTAFGEGFGEGAGRVFVFGEEKHARRGPVEAMGCEEALPRRALGAGNGGIPLRVQGRGVGQEAGGFVDGEEPAVVVDDFKGLGIALFHSLFTMRRAPRL